MPTHLNFLVFGFISILTNIYLFMSIFRMVMAEQKLMFILQ